MEVIEFVRKLENEFEELEKGTLSPEMNIKDIPDFSSMHALILIAFVDSEFDIILTGDDLKSVQTIQELYDLILQKKQH